MNYRCCHKYLPFRTNRTGRKKRKKGTDTQRFSPATHQKQLARKRYHIIQAWQLAKQAGIIMPLFPERSLLPADESAFRKIGGTRNTIPVAENILRKIISEIRGIPLNVYH